jgi:hypothetical protein
MPFEALLQLAPASAVAQAPPQDMPVTIRRLSPGWIAIECRPGASLPPPNQSFLPGIASKASLRCQVAPLSSERNSPAGMVPAQIVPGMSAPAGSSAQIMPTLGASLSSAFGKAGTATSLQRAPPSSE